MRFRDLQERLPHPNTLGLLFILVLSYFTIFHNYSIPQHFFWDENYHIASAQKYLNGIFFMEPHPPLGKMLIALGEKLLNQNALDNQFIGTDYATSPPADFSFTGYRFFPVLFAWLTAPLVFGIFLILTRRSLWAVFLSFFYVFDTAIIVHVRGAMLEGPLMFFSALTIFAFLLLLERRDDLSSFRRAAFLFGFAFAGVMLTKVFGLILILLVPALFFFVRRYRGRFPQFLLWGAIGFLPFYILVWQMHFTMASQINPSLPDAGFYQASDQYKQLLTTGRNRSIFAFPVMLRDSMNFVSHYEKGVPLLNLCKKDENGSPWFVWPMGGRSINYRWETPNGQAYRYLYLQVNPMIWFLSLLGILAAGAMLLASFLLPLRESLQHRPLLATFFVLYVSYMAAISHITRVMYLYHYFIPLLISFLLFALVFLEIQHMGKFRLHDERKATTLLLLGLLIFVSYQFYRPLAYYEPLTDSQFERRSLLQIWELRCVRCAPNSPFVQNPDS